MKANGSFNGKIDGSGLIISITEKSSHQNTDPIYHWPALFLLFFSIFGILGNLLVCIAIGTERRLHNRTNWFLFSLALADMFISAVVIPLAIVKEFTGFWILGPILCDLWIFLDVCSCTSSIMHIVVISIDRYLAIEDPLNVRCRQKKYQICLLIIFIWLIAILLSSPMIILGVINPYNIIINGQCFINNQFFVLYGSVVSFVIPLLIVIVTYALTVRRLKEQIKQCQIHFAQEQISNTVNLVAKPFLRRQIASTNVLNLSSQSTLIPTRESKGQCLQRQETSLDLNQEHLRHLNLQKDNKNLTNDFERSKVQKSFAHTEYACPKNPFCQLKCTCHHQQQGQSVEEEKKSNCLQCDESITPIRSHSARKPRPITFPNSTISNQSSSTMFNPLRRQWHRSTLQPSLASTRAKSSAVRNEQKAVKVLGVVFVIFVVAWFPFCILNILRAVCKRCSINEHLLNGFVWLGYVSSTINPVVYTIFNRNFRLKFITLLKCQCLYSNNRQKQFAYYQSHSSLHGSRIFRINGLIQNDIQRFNAPRQKNEPTLT